MTEDTHFDRDDSATSKVTAIYLLLFIVPATTTFFLLNGNHDWALTETSIVSVAVLNASINGVIAYLTIRLDGKSNDTLDHLDVVIDATEDLDDTLKDANEKVTSFTSDLDEAKNLFQKVGVNLTELDLGPIAEVVEKMKENKDGLNEVLDNLRDVDISDYISHAKRIDWKQLLNAAEEILAFIQTRPITPGVSTEDIMKNMNLPDKGIIRLQEETDWPEETTWDNEEDDEEWEEDTKEYAPPTLNLKRNKPLSLKRR